MKIFRPLFAAIAVFASFAGFSAQAAEKITLQLRWHHQFQFAGYYAAKEKGFYREAGFDVTIVAGEPGRKPINEVLAGRAQYGTANSEVLLRRLKGDPLVALATIFQHSAMTLLTREDSDIRSPHDLIGRNVMSIGDAEIYAMLRSEGIDPDRVDFRESSYNIDDLVAGETDAFNAYLTNEPFFLKNLGIPFISLKPSTYGIDFYSDILFTTEKEIRNHPDQVFRFRAATLRGWQYAMQHSDEIIDLIRSKYGSEKTIEHLQFEANTMRQLVQPENVEIGHMNPGRWRHMADIFVKEGMIDPEYSLIGFMYDPNAPKDLMVFLGHMAAAPYVFFENGKPVGAFVDLLNAVGKVLERPVEVRLYQWADAQARFRRGEGHALTSMAISKERKEFYDFSQSTFDLEYVLFVKSQLHDQIDMKNWSGMRIAIRRGGYAISIIENRHPEAEAVYIETILDGFQMVLSGTVDGVIAEKLSGHYTLRQNEIQGIEAIQTPLSARTVHIPVIKGNSALLEDFDKAISELKSAGTIDAISRRWLGGPVFFISSDQRNAAFVGAAITLLIFSVLVTLLLINIKRRNAAHKRTETIIKASLAEKEVLLREIHHRVKNNLQVISSMLSLQAQSGKNKATSDALLDSERRIRVMAEVHEHLCQSKDMARVESQSYLKSIINDIKKSQLDESGHILINEDIEQVILDIDVATIIGQITSEMVSNALKHAFPNDRSGTVTISLKRLNGEDVELYVADDGIGLPEGLNIAESKSLGLQLIDTLSTMIKGKLLIGNPPGANFQMVFKCQLQ